MTDKPYHLGYHYYMTVESFVRLSARCYATTVAIASVYICGTSFRTIIMRAAAVTETNERWTYLIHTERFSAEKKIGSFNAYL